jgi:hypothetical protein
LGLYNRPEVAAVPGDVSPTPWRKKSSGVVSLFTDVPVEGVLQFIRTRLNMNPFPARLPLQLEELLDICLTTTYFQF